MRLLGQAKSEINLRQVQREYLESGLPLYQGLLEASIRACGNTKAFSFGWVHSLFPFHAFASQSVDGYVGLSSALSQPLTFI